jgi:hypothetical protein
MEIDYESWMPFEIFEILRKRGDIQQYYVLEDSIVMPIPHETVIKHVWDGVCFKSPVTMAELKRTPRPPPW